MLVTVASGWALRGPVCAYLEGLRQPSVLGAGPTLAVAGSTDAESRAQPQQGQNRQTDEDEGAQESGTQGEANRPNAGFHASRAVSGVQTRPLSAWLSDVAHEADRDLVLSPELHGDLTATLGSRLAWEQRLAAFARVFGFDFEVGDGLIEVRPQARSPAPGRQRRDRDVAGFASGDAAGADDAMITNAGGSTGAASGELGAASVASPTMPGANAAAIDKPAPPIETRIAALAHAPAKDLAGVLAKAAEPLGISVVPELSTNALVISGTRGAIDRAFAVLRELDRPRRRVLLEAKIVELTHSARLDLGVDWKLSGDVGADVKFPAPVSAAGNAALVLATGGAYALDARISAMEADGRVRVVSRPSVVMLEGSPASVESVRIMRIRLPSRAAVVGGDVVEVDSGQRATEEIPVGVRLEVTPAVRAGRRVLLRIKAKSSSLGAPLPPDDIPEELSRMVDAELLVADGETAVLGGLQREAGQRNGAGVPVLRNVPLLGNLFGRHSREREDEELLVMVTPRVLD